ncbi:MAG: hypothetical protein H6741_20090 [Alphaproteobacteria bacterium]|nr:hypothetical protein [Alphaproteobacteria bacterium]
MKLPTMTATASLNAPRAPYVGGPLVGPGGLQPALGWDTVKSVGSAAWGAVKTAVPIAIDAGKCAVRCGGPALECASRCGTDAGCWGTCALEKGPGVFSCISENCL